MTESSAAFSAVPAPGDMHDDDHEHSAAVGEEAGTGLPTPVAAHPSAYADDPDSPDGEQLDLADRQALRRVPGLSTELADVTEVEYRQLRLERVVLVGVGVRGSDGSAENSLVELAALAETAGALVLGGVIQRRDRPDPATYVGSGKVEELRGLVSLEGADTVICDGELSPSQLRNLEERVKVKVVDRTALILDIFAQHAQSREGKAQVELAQLNYLVPRLRGWGESLSRQAGGRAGGATGGVGLRGPGETKLETDRRRIRTRISRLRHELAGMAAGRTTRRASRMRHAVPAVAIVGYTNAGKSSLLNRLTGAGVLVEDALFATLDPTVRRARTPDGREFTLTDTVGFVRQLPHQLVEAFRSTLEEVAQADLLLHVVDASDAEPEQQVKAVHTVLDEIDAVGIPEIIVVNKIDSAAPDVLDRLRRELPGSVAVSARTAQGINELIRVVNGALPQPEVELRVLVPYERGDLVARTHAAGDVLRTEHRADGTWLHARVRPDLAAALAEYTERPAGS